MSEILGTLFKYIVVSISVAAVVFIFYRVLNNDKANSTISQLAQIQTNTQALFVSQTSFSSLTSQVAINAGLVPKEMISGTTLVNAWNGAVAIQSESSGAQFSVTEGSVPKDACIKLATAAAGYISMAINGGTSYLSTSPIDPGSASTECAAGGDTNSLKFYYGR